MHFEEKQQIYGTISTASINSLFFFYGDHGAGFICFEFCITSGRSCRAVYQAIELLCNSVTFLASLRALIISAISYGCHVVIED